MTLLNLDFKLEKINFGATLLFELRQDQNGVYYISVLISTSENGIKMLKMRECDQLCNLGNFFDLTSDRTVSNFTESCMNEQRLTRNVSILIQDPSSANPIVCANLNTSSIAINALSSQHQHNGLTKLEVGLIVSTTILAALLLAFLAIVLYFSFRNKNRRAVF